jgi:hypothetical protein
VQRVRIFQICLGLLWLATLLALAVFAQRFAEFGSASRQAEAKRNLVHIHTLQKVFYDDQGRYGNFTESSCEPNEIGFTQVNCEHARYEYSMTINDDQTGFEVRARERVINGSRAVFPDCTEPLDEWKIDEQRNLHNVFQAGSVCAGSSARVFKLPSLGAFGVSIGACLLLIVLFCLFEIVSTLFLPAGVSTKKVLLKLSVVSPPLAVLGALLVMPTMILPFLSAKFLFASLGIVILFTGFFYSRWIVVRGIPMSGWQKSAVIAAVPSALFLAIIVLTLAPGSTKLSP